jgi:His/Glu/Gln/Arg/opine family amino acid ABC transporter permease subunit
MASRMMINWTLIQQSLPILISAAVMSLKIAFISCGIGILLGTLLGVLQAENNKFIRFLIGIYVTVIRGTPMLIQISFYYFAFGLPAFGAAVLGIGLNSAAYVSQIIRSGISSVGKGQIEAARVLGFSKQQITRFIVLPQALRIVLPALGNEFITLIKDSSLASVVGVVELYRQSTVMITRTYDPLSIYAAAALIYLSMTSILSLALHFLERRLNRASH